jgi:dTDP-4-dehydrorhamnose 3,5-epimerase
MISAVNKSHSFSVMKITENSKLKGVFEIILSPHRDERGFHMRIFDEQLFAGFNLPVRWMQENHSLNLKKNTLRGLHFILPPHTDGKLIRCIRGKIFDVFVDLRKDSPTSGQWDSKILDETEFIWLYIPKGFAHGFCSLTDQSELIYKHDTVYQRNFDCGIIWNDPVINISWPCREPIVSEKDKQLMSYSDFIKRVGGL